MTRRRLVRVACSVAVLSAALGLAACSAASTGASSSSGSEQAAAQPFWTADFDGPAGTRPDAAWTVQTGNHEWSGWGNDELQYYTDDARTSALDGNGHLVLRAEPAAADEHLPCWPDGADCAWVSARLTTAGAVTLDEGRIEVRAKLPTGTGLLPAIWTMGENDRVWPANGEIDIAEVVGPEPQTVYGTLHGPGYSDEGGISASAPLGAPASEDFHVYGVERAPGRITWTLDGRPYSTVTPADLPEGAPWVADGPFHLILNVAVGGSWPGDPDASTPRPAELVVDWIRFTGEGAVLTGARGRED